MAITLRYTGTDTGGKATELTYQEMNDNLKSYYYSSSLSASILELYTTGSETHSINLASFLDDTNTNIYNTDSELESDRTVTANGNTLTFDMQTADFSIITQTGRRVIVQGLDSTDQGQVLAIDSNGVLSAMNTSSIATDTTIDTGSFYLSSSVSLNTITFTQGDGTTESVTVDTGSGGGTPGGSNTYVQFNDSGAFGGDSGLLYDKNDNKLTVVSADGGATTNPTIQLGTSDVSIAPGDTVGRISFSNTDSTYGGGTSYAAIYAIAPSNWGGGNYPKDIRIAAVQYAATVDVATFKGDGEVKLHKYGSGSFTGTTSKYVAVSASGELIETDITDASDLTRPGSATSHTFNTDITNSSNYVWQTELGSGAPSGAGKMRVGMTLSPKDASTVTAITFSTASDSGARTNTLYYLQEGGTIAFRNTGGTLVVDNFTIKEVNRTTSGSGYVTVYVSGAPSVDIDNVTDYRVDFSSDVRIELEDQSYHRLSLVNQSSNGANVVFVPSPAATFGDYIAVEAIAGSGNLGACTLYHTHYSTGATTTLNDVYKAVWWMNGTNTVSTLSVDYSGYGQIAMAHFRVVDYGNPSLAYIGADRILG